MSIKSVLESYKVPELRLIIRQHNKKVQAFIKDELKEIREKFKKEKLIKVTGMKNKSDIINEMLKHETHFKNVPMRPTVSTEEQNEFLTKEMQPQLNKLYKEYKADGDEDELTDGVNLLYKLAKSKDLKPFQSKKKMIAEIKKDVADEKAKEPKGKPPRPAKPPQFVFKDGRLVLVSLLEARKLRPPKPTRKADTVGVLEGTHEMKGEGLMTGEQHTEDSKPLIVITEAGGKPPKKEEPKKEVEINFKYNPSKLKIKEQKNLMDDVFYNIYYSDNNVRIDGSVGPKKPPYFYLETYDARNDKSQPRAAKGEANFYLCEVLKSLLKEKKLKLKETSDFKLTAGNISDGHNQSKLNKYYESLGFKKDGTPSQSGSQDFKQSILSFMKNCEKFKKKEYREAPKKDDELKELKKKLKKLGLPSMALKFIKSVEQAKEKLKEIEEEEEDDKSIQVIPEFLSKTSMINQPKVKKLVLRILPRDEYNLQDQRDYFETLKKTGDEWNSSPNARQKYGSYDEDEKALFELLYSNLFDKKKLRESGEAQREKRKEEKKAAKEAAAKEKK